MNKTFCPHGFPPLLCNACATQERCEHGMPGDCLLCGLKSFKLRFDLATEAAATATSTKANANDPFTVPKGQLTFDAEGAEGGKYHSRKAHWPGGASGVTIGRGYDMKERSKTTIIADLTAAGVPSTDAKTLGEGAGKSGSDASSFVNKAAVAKIELTAEAQKALFITVYDEKAAGVRRISDKADAVAKYGSVNWSKLHPAILDIAVDLIFRGDYRTDTRVSVQPHIVANDLQGLYDVLSDEDTMTDDWGVPPDRFERRKNYLKAALDAEKAQKVKKA